jgi:hypothetical protein
MVESGLAEVYRGKPAPEFNNEPYWIAAKKAQAAAIGMLSVGDEYISPRDWRKTH